MASNASVRKCVHLLDAKTMPEKIKVLKADSHELRLTYAAVADSCITAADIGNFLFFACTLLCSGTCQTQLV